MRQGGLTPRCEGRFKDMENYLIRRNRESFREARGRGVDLMTLDEPVESHRCPGALWSSPVGSQSCVEDTGPDIPKVSFSLTRRLTAAARALEVTGREEKDLTEPNRNRTPVQLPGWQQTSGPFLWVREL